MNRKRAKTEALIDNEILSNRKRIDPLFENLNTHKERGSEEILKYQNEEGQFKIVRKTDSNDLILEREISSKNLKEISLDFDFEKALNISNLEDFEVIKQIYK